MKNDNIWELRGMIEMLIDNEDELVQSLVSILNLTENDFISKIEAKQPILAIDTGNQHEANNGAGGVIETINNNIEIVIEHCNKRSAIHPAILCYLIQLACYEKLNSSENEHKPDDQWSAEKHAELSNRYEKFTAVRRNEMNSIRQLENLSRRAEQLELRVSVRLAFACIACALVVSDVLYRRYACHNDNGDHDNVSNTVLLVATLLCLVEAPTVVSMFADHSLFSREKSPTLKFIQPPSQPKASATCPKLC